MGGIRLENLVHSHGPEAAASLQLTYAGAEALKDEIDTLLLESREGFRILQRLECGEIDARKAASLLFDEIKKINVNG